MLHRKIKTGYFVVITAYSPKFLNTNLNFSSNCIAVVHLIQKPHLYGTEQ